MSTAASRCVVATFLYLSTVGCAPSFTRSSQAGVVDAPSTRVVMPGPALVSHITLMLDETWWLMVERNGPSSIGYGALPYRVGLRPDGVALQDVYTRIAGHVRMREPRGEGGGHWFGLVFSTVGGQETSIVFDVDAESYPSLLEMFRRAYRDVDRDSPHSRSPEVIVRYWERAFFLTGRQDSTLPREQQR